MTHRRVTRTTTLESTRLTFRRRSCSAPPPPILQRLTGRRPAVNYGRSGAVIGHEISHGFRPTKAAQYDGDGNMRAWWTKEDPDTVAAKDQGIGRRVQRGHFANRAGYHLNGELTIGENSRNSGIDRAFKAYQIGSAKNRHR